MILIFLNKCTYLWRSQDIAFLSLYHLLVCCFCSLNFTVTPSQLGIFGPGLISSPSHDIFAICVINYLCHYLVEHLLLYFKGGNKWKHTNIVADRSRALHYVVSEFLFLKLLVCSESTSDLRLRLKFHLDYKKICWLVSMYNIWKVSENGRNCCEWHRRLMKN